MRMLERTDIFEVDREGNLVHKVTPKWPHKPYEHRCSLQFYEQVAHEAEDLAEEGVGFTGEDIALRTGMPSTCVFTALAFLKERGCIDTEGKRNYGKIGTHLDAMIEYHALREREREQQVPEPPADDGAQPEEQA